MNAHRTTPLRHYPVKGFVKHPMYYNLGPVPPEKRMPMVQAESDVLAAVRNEFGIDHYNPRHVPVIPLRVEYIFGFGLADGIFVRQEDYITCGCYRDGEHVTGYPAIPIELDIPDEL
jgi:hypothetical protein